ncbi:hypothetical protein [Actinoplanes sp. NPDC051851]|uniref:hypothetical protein n=1 Tax=Actinoplanes sp. NPDC051851 TaxID=3154753 RepID=UPI00343B62D9
MHDEVLALIDDCVTELSLLRTDIGDSRRRVSPGERLDAVLRAIDVAERFAESASTAISHDESIAFTVDGADSGTLTASGGRIL